MITVVISVCRVASPSDGGDFWVYMQYAEGLRRLGCEVYWLEQLRAVAPGLETWERARFLHRMRRFGFDGKALLYTTDRFPAGNAGAIRFLGHTLRDALAVLSGADLLLNFHYAIPPRLLGSARRTALVDINPGLLQHRMATGLLAVSPHDRYLTTGESVGTSAALFPDCGLSWTWIRPPVCLELWPPVAESGAQAFTTISSWATPSFLRVTKNGVTEILDNSKRASFLAFVNLPRHVRWPLELALFLSDRRAPALVRPRPAEQDDADRAYLERHGWRVRDAHEVAGSPEAYRGYIQASRGELSCARRSCLIFQNAWVGNRTLCYLASGRPVVVQHTGPSSYLPDGEGMFRFRSLAQAVEALAVIEAHYERHSRAAREIAEAYFDARQVLEPLLNAALGAPAHTVPAATADGGAP